MTSFKLNIDQKIAQISYGVISQLKIGGTISRPIVYY